MTKDVREWVWVSLWWDPTAKTEDFGSDQPASLAAFNNGVWKNYKMCVVSALAEKDPQPWATYTGSNETLAESIKAVYDAIQKEVDTGAESDPAALTTLFDDPPVPLELPGASPGRSADAAVVPTLTVSSAHHLRGEITGGMDLHFGQTNRTTSFSAERMDRLSLVLASVRRTHHTAFALATYTHCAAVGLAGHGFPRHADLNVPKLVLSSPPARARPREPHSEPGVGRRR